jgi:uncharacterized protein (DUF1778 family)
MYIVCTIDPSKEATVNTITPPALSAESTDQRASKEGRLNLRVTERQDHLIRRAAAALDKSVTEFVLESVALEAERVLAEQRWFMLSEAEWTRFHELIDQPLPSDDQRLRRLLSERRQIDLSGL